ncbi:hypothetical protein [Streptomyces marianii]|uniref:FtsX-like permease family protein n=1 Tax=Streptomyces marianii TaxID=1817406 RepID=A0A5R9E8M5_9ACTN|nr:hypothetical protein [Streptomyces marianii]TLQ44574.1 hypothetical protein FEF34_16890 [Streptomyces marianii]
MKGGKHLAVQLLRVGRAAGAGSRGGLIRTVALLCAAAALTFAAGALVSAAAVYGSMEQQSEARSPRVLQGHPTEKPIALWKPGFDVVGGLQYSVVSVVPLTADAPPPPGVTAWPRPGEAVLSPALAEAAAAEGSSGRLGRDVGRIGEAGLVNSTERLAYVRPLDSVVDKERMFTITGYGAKGPYIGDPQFAEPLELFALAVIGLMIFPAAVLVVIAARAGGEARDRRAALLDALGASQTARSLVNVGEAGLPVLLGAVLGLGSLMGMVAAGISLPFTGFTIPAASVRAAAVPLGLTATACVLVVLVLVVVLHRHNASLPTTRPGIRSRRLPRWWPALFPVSLLLATRGPGLLAPDNPRLFLAVYFVAALITFATLPAVLALMVAALGRLLARLGRRRGGTGTLVAGRWLTAQPGVTARLVAGFVVAIGLIGQVQLNTSRLSEPMLAAQATAQRIGTSVLTVATPRDNARTSAFLAHLPTDAAVFSLRTGPAPDGSVLSVLQAPCEELRAIQRDCGGAGFPATVADRDARLAELARWYAPSGRIQLREGPLVSELPAEESSQVVLMAPLGKNLDIAAVKHAANLQLAVASVVEAPGGGWLSSALLRGSRVTWVTLFGCFALIVVGLAIGLNSIAEFLRHSRSFAPLGVLTGRRRLFVSVAAWVLLMPTVMAAAIGALVYLWLSGPYTDPVVGAQLSWPVLGYLLGGVLILSVSIWGCGAWSAVRGASRWRPAAD